MGKLKDLLIEKQEEFNTPIQLSLDLFDDEEKGFDDWEQFKREELEREKWEDED